MDPLHPETAVPRVKELSKQLDRVLSDFKKATTAGKLAELEREGALVVQEMALVAPRLHEVVIQASRSQRTAIARGAAFGYKPEERVGKYIKTTIALEEKPVEKSELEYHPEHGGGTVTLEYRPVEKSQEKCEKEAQNKPEKCEKTEVEPAKPKAKKNTKKAKK